MLSQAEEIVALRRATDETKAMVEERLPVVVEVGANDDFASFRWPEQSKGFRDDDVRTFRGLYAAVYRRSSALVHPTQEGMERHMELTDTGIVIGLDEQQAEPRAPVGFAVPMMAFMLIVYAHHFEWPDQEIVSALEGGLNNGD